MVALTRRTVMMTLAAGMTLAGPARAQAAGGQMLAIRGTRLYVEDSGPKDAPALLYLHGGPGAGSFDFSLYQRDRLNKTVRTVIMDQRGVLRSDPVDACTIDDLVEDCEGVRQALGITRWTVIGHSFGGMLALLYATKHPEAVNRVIFENPAIDIRTSVQSLLVAAAVVFERIGRPRDARLARDLALSNTPAAGLWGKFGDIGGRLGAHRDDLYTHQPALHDFFGKMIAASGLPAQDWARGGDQQALLNKDPVLFEDHRPLLAKLSMPSVLFKGAFDHVTSTEQIEALAAARHAQPVRLFGNSSHFVHVEEPDAYATAVGGFMRA